MALSFWTFTFPSLLCLGLFLLSSVEGQEEFQGPITCYLCYDKAINSTCGDPRFPDDEEVLDTITCKRGACVKWTYYVHSVLMMQRTCSEKVNMKIPLNTVCRTERNGNGYLCMCAKDQCNSGTKQTFHSLLIMISIASLLLLVFNGL